MCNRSTCGSVDQLGFEGSEGTLSLVPACFRADSGTNLIKQRVGDVTGQHVDR